jgi:hypothetical protein
MPRLTKPVYESLPAFYALLGAGLLWLSYRYDAAWWSSACVLAGFLAVIAGLVIWMHRRAYRATSRDYQLRGRPVAEPRSEDPR